MLYIMEMELRFQVSVEIQDGPSDVRADTHVGQYLGVRFSGKARAMKESATALLNVNTPLPLSCFQMAF